MPMPKHWRTGSSTNCASATSCRKANAAPASASAPRSIPVMGQKPVEAALDHDVAFAGDGFEALAVQDDDIAPRIADQPILLQLMLRHRHPGPPHAEHHREKL